ncbi:MAG: hypothetical protein HQ514_05055 [Rhodospirillales bacterium]|nr:hypothetical protein [Rhodospirillales bacterium]
MTSVLKGNFTPKKDVKPAAKEQEDLEATFEASALKRLGGSIAFVSKKRVNWDLEDK